jgi:hypothetical protein
MSVSCECCVLSGRGLCFGLTTRPENSYWVWCVWVWLWSPDSEVALAHLGLSRHAKKKKKKIYIYIYRFPEIWFFFILLVEAFFQYTVTHYSLVRILYFQVLVILRKAVHYII